MSLKEAAYALDPVLWARDVLAFNPDPWQAEVLRSGSKRILLNCSRQSGKSMITAALALHTALYQPGSLILCLSPTLRQSGELFHTISAFYSNVTRNFPAAAESALRLELENGSRIISLPGLEQNVRGYAGVALLVVDEAARVPDDLYFAIKPMLAVSDGRLIALSTPFGRRGWFWHEWSEGRNWERHQIKATDCPRISPEFLNSEREAMPESWFAAEYMCEFTDAEDACFSSSTIEKMFDSNVKPLWGDSI